MAKIIDVILHKNKHSTQTFIVLDKYPEMLYERRGEYLIGEDSGFFNFYAYEKPGKTWKAFAGRKFKIPMKDGTFIDACGQWWDKTPPDYSELGLLFSVGAGIPEDLANCNVFSSLMVDTTIIDDWLDNNEPSNNYHKYDAMKKDTFMKHTIISEW